MISPSTITIESASYPKQIISVLHLYLIFVFQFNLNLLAGCLISANKCLITQVRGFVEAMSSDELSHAAPIPGSHQGSNEVSPVTPVSGFDRAAQIKTLMPETTPMTIKFSSPWW